MWLRKRISNWILALPKGYWLIVLGYLFLGTLYATMTPIFEKPDENWHFAFAMYMVETGHLPVQTLAGRDHLAEQEGSQPPLYYAWLAGTLKLAGFSSLEPGFRELTEKNPYYGGRVGAWRENANQFVRGRCDTPACQQTARAVYIGRGLSLLSGLLALFGMTLTVQLAFPQKLALERSEGPLLLYLAVGGMAFMPQFLHISSSVSNDVLTLAWVNLAFAGALWWLNKPASPWRVLFLGAVVGLATLTKPSGLSIVITIGLWLLIGGKLAWRMRIRQIVVYGSTFLVVSGWWFVRNLWLYGEATATEIHLQVYGVPAPVLTWNTFEAEWKAVFNSFWASFGWGAINPSDEIYSLARWVAFGLLLSFGALVWRRWKGWHDSQRFLVSLGLFHTVLVVLLLFRWMRLTVAPLGRLLFPAMLPLMLMWAWGALHLIPLAWRRFGARIGVAAWATIAMACLVLLIRPAYLPLAAIDSLPASATPLNVQFGDRIRLVGYERASEELQLGSVVKMTLYWQALRPIEEAWSVAVKLFGRDEQLLAESHSYPDGGRRATQTWQPGQILPERVFLAVSHKGEVPTVADVEIDLFRNEDLSWLPATIEGQSIRPLRPFAFVVREENKSASSSAAFRVRPLIEQVMLKEQQVEAHIVWEVGQPLEQDYQAFFHLSSSPNHPPIVPADFPPLNDEFPTRYWEPGDRLSDQASLSLPTDIDAGEYVLLLGLYDLATRERLMGEGTQEVWRVASLAWDGYAWTLHESE